MSSIQPPAPQRRTMAPVRPGRPLPGAGRHAKRTEACNEIAGIAGMLCMAKGQLADAAAIGMHADNVIREVVKIGDEVEEVGKVLDYLTVAGPYAGLMKAGLPLLAQFAVNHDKVKPNALMGDVVPKAVLEAQARAELAEMELAALVKQRKAEDKVREMEREFQAFSVPEVASPNGAHARENEYV